MASLASCSGRKTSPGKRNEAADCGTSATPSLLLAILRREFLQREQESGTGAQVRITVDSLLPQLETYLGATGSDMQERKRLGHDEPAPLIVPILVGSLHELAITPPGKETENHNTRIIDDVLPMLQTRVGERIQRGDQVMWLGVGDLAHVGPRFGDMEPVSDDDRDSLERRDQQTLTPVLSGDAPSFFGEIRRERDRRRILGLGAIYTFLRASRASSGSLRCYAQCSVGPGSYISTASIVYP